MARVLSIFLMILVMNKQALSLDMIANHVGTIKQTLDHMNLIYQIGAQYINKDFMKTNNSSQQLENIPTELRTISKWLMNFENNQDENINLFGESSSNNIAILSDFISVRSELVDHINDVNFLFKKGVALMENKNYNINTLETFIESVLRNTNNLEHSLFKIHALILPGMNENIRYGFITLARSHVQGNYERLCNKENSPQQLMYNVFLLLIRTHLKGFVTITQAYSMQSVFHNSSYIQEYKDSKQKLQEQLTDYFESFKHELNTFPADIHKCNIENPVIGKNVYEMEGLFQVLVNYESNIKKTVYIQGTPFCGDCEEIKNYRYDKFLINNCKTYDLIRGCPTSELPDNAENIRFSWFESDSETFGHSGQCNHNMYELESYFGTKWCFNDICVCSVNLTNQNYFPKRKWGIHIDEPKIRKFSVEPQYSDIANNMIVVGVKFILHDNAIHLQIQQSKISRNEAVVEKAAWKPVDVDNNNEKINIRYSNVFYKRHSLYLDDVIVHPGFVVTGVKLQLSKSHDGFELHVHATEYNHGTGLLSGSGRWFAPGEYSPNHQDYQRSRTQIEMDDPDDPTKAYNYHADSQTNKFIQFQHTSIKKDAGFHTVPFFDGQSVESPQFPLGGIGLFYRQRDGFGGYIAPRLFTYNITWDIESSLNRQKIEEAYVKCGLEVPPNVTGFTEDANCETLQQIANQQIISKYVDRTKHMTSSFHPQPLSNYYYSSLKKPNDPETINDNIIIKISKNN